MKKNLIITLILGTSMLLASCANSQEGQVVDQEETGKLSIVVSTFNEYDWLLQVLGERKDEFDVTLLLDSGLDMHSYEPSVEDIVTINSADLFIYNGGHSQTWIAEAIADPTNDNFKSINVMESLGDVVQEEVTVEGMQVGSIESSEHDHSEDEHDHSEDEHDHSEDEHDHDHDEGHAHDDEHVWLSLNNAMTICEIIGEEVAELDSDNATIYTTNAENYIQELSDLHAEYETAIATAQRDTLIFADRFPFLYMMQDYDVNYYAAFQGCAAETEASFETIKFLSEKVDELDVNYLLVIDNGLIELAETVISSSEDKDAETIVLHSMQTVTEEEIAAGASYYNFMQENLETLKLALAE